MRATPTIRLTLPPARVFLVQAAQRRGPRAVEVLPGLLVATVHRPVVAVLLLQRQHEPLGLLQLLRGQVPKGVDDLVDLGLGPHTSSSRTGPPQPSTPAPPRCPSSAAAPS